MNTNTIIHRFKKQTDINMTKNKMIYLIVMLIISACTNVPNSSATEKVAEKPIVKDYKIGETLTWDWRRSVEGEVRAQGEDYREVVKFKNTLGFYYGNNDTVKIATVINKKASKTPLYEWPLKVGKKWKYEVKWSNDEGTTGKTSQDAEVVSYGEVTVAAGKFMAYKIEYKGRISNSRGYDAEMKDVWWYAPAIQTYIKHTQDDGEGLYINELINYSNPI